MRQTITVLMLFAIIKLSAQPIDCAPILEFRHPDPSFTRSEHSQSIQGFTGEKYEFVVPVEVGEQYRFTFFVSAILTREIDFKIEDINSGQVLLDLPGTTKENKKNESVLGTYYDELYGKMIYPYFDFNPKSKTTYKVTVDIAKYKRPAPKYKAVDEEYFAEELKKEKKEKEKNKKTAFTPPEEKRTGCITMYIQKRKAYY